VFGKVSIWRREYTGQFPQEHSKSWSLFIASSAGGYLPGADLPRMNQSVWLRIDMGEREREREGEREREEARERQRDFVPFS